MTKKSGENLNILKTKRDFKMTPKLFLILFKGLSVARNCLRPQGVSSNHILSVELHLSNNSLRIFVRHSG